MGLFLRLALKNLIRNRRRTIITEVAIAAGAMVIIIAVGLLASIKDSWQEGIINKDVGHLQIMQQAFFEKSRTASPELMLHNTQALETYLRRLPEIEAFAPSLTIGGLVAKDDDTTTFFGAGIQMPQSKQVLPQMDSQLISGSFPSHDEEAACIIGKGMAKSLGLKVGDLLVLMTSTLQGQLNAVDVELKGIVQTGQPILDEGLLLTTLSTARRLLDAPMMSTKYTVRLQKEAKVAPTVATINQWFTSQKDRRSKAFSWMDLSSEFKNVNALFGVISNSVALIIFFLVGIGIANTMLMNVLERTGEIGVIMAIGTQKNQVVRLFVLEGLVLALVGTCIGVSLGCVITLLLGHIGIPFTPPDITIKMTLYPRLVPSGIIEAMVLSIVVSTLASIYPARYASRLDPAVIFAKN